MLWSSHLGRTHPALCLSANPSPPQGLPRPRLDRCPPRAAPLESGGGELTRLSEVPPERRAQREPTGEVDAHCATLGVPATPAASPVRPRAQDDILHVETRERGDPAAHTGLGPHTPRAQDAIPGESDAGTLSGRRFGRLAGAGSERWGWGEESDPVPWFGPSLPRPCAVSLGSHGKAGGVYTLCSVFFPSENEKSVCFQPYPGPSPGLPLQAWPWWPRSQGCRSSSLLDGIRRQP